MQFIKIGDTIVNKNQIKYIEKGKDTPRFSGDAIRHTISTIFAGGDEWHYLDLYFGTERVGILYKKLLKLHLRGLI